MCSWSIVRSSRQTSATPNGVKDATTDRTIIKDWWNRWPDANVGIAMGRASGIFVLDVDGNVGKASLKELQAQHGRLKKTVTVQTAKDATAIFGAMALVWATPPVALAKESMSAAMAAMWSPPGVSMLREPPIALSMGEDWTRWR